MSSSTLFGFVDFTAAMWPDKLRLAPPREIGGVEPFFDSRF